MRPSTASTPCCCYEPRAALVAPDARGIGGLGDLEVIITHAIGWLTPGGALVCEHGDAHRDAVLQLAASAGFSEVTDHDDLAGLPRVLVARK